MLKIYLEDLVINSLICTYEALNISAIDEEKVLIYEERLCRILKEKGINFQIKKDEKRQNELMNSQYINIDEKNGKKIYKIKKELRIEDLFNTRRELPKELIFILEDNTIKEALCECCEKQKIKKLSYN